jgi:hypothetical protein
MNARRPRPRFRGVCAICDQTNDTTLRCDKCRADPANADWVETWEDCSEGLDGVVLEPGERLADLAERPLREPTQLRGLILDMALRGVYEPAPRIDRRGHRRGSYMRYRQLSLREIARRAGCSHVYVLNLIRQQVG